MWSRRFLAILCALTVFATSGVAWAGSYLNRASVLLAGARIERDLVRSRSDDTELLRVVHRIAEARLRAAQDMRVPQVVATAHPHLMLALENSERAYVAALRRDIEKFVDHIMRARTEDKTFRAIIKKIGYTLPRAVR